MSTNEIKKELYKQKPIAEFGYARDGFKNYSCELLIGGFEEIIEFNVPDSEASFEDKVPAQLLIRWIV